MIEEAYHYQSAVDSEVKILLSLKAQYKELTGKMNDEIATNKLFICCFSSTVLQVKTLLVVQVAGRRKTSNHPVELLGVERKKNSRKTSSHQPRQPAQQQLGM